MPKTGNKTRHVLEEMRCTWYAFIIIFKVLIVGPRKAYEKTEIMAISPVQIDRKKRR